MVEIYRIENKKSESPYFYKHRAVINRVMASNFLAITANRPIPLEDKGINRYPLKNEICGFKNVKQALKWFNAKEIRRMRRLGFDIKKVKVQKITEIGECQLLAIK